MTAGAGARRRLEMNRRRFFTGGLALAGSAALAGSLLRADDSPTATAAADSPSPATDLALVPPAEGPIRVAFCISEGSNVIDMAGPWEVFQDVMVDRGGHHHHPFALYTVATDTRPVRATGGLHLLPDHTFADAPAPQVVVVPAMRGSDDLHAWLRTTATTADLVMSVCTGAFQLARAGLLDGLAATTHHDFWDDFARQFPKVDLRRGPRYVEHPRIATAGGLTSGIDLALRVVARYFGEAAASQTAEYMEWQGEGWRRAG